jgi:hypothetical protein
MTRNKYAVSVFIVEKEEEDCWEVAYSMEL